MRKPTEAALDLLDALAWYGGALSGQFGGSGRRTWSAPWIRVGARMTSRAMIRPWRPGRGGSGATPINARITQATGLERAGLAVWLRDQRQERFEGDGPFPYGWCDYLVITHLGLEQVSAETRAAWQSWPMRFIAAPGGELEIYEEVGRAG